MEEANFSELREKINSWDIEAEQMLIQKVKFFTLKYNDEFQSICKNFDNFSNSLSSVESGHLKAINQLKNLSSERFIEQSLDKTEAKPQESDTKENILISEQEKIKKSLEIVFPFIETLSKKNKKEAIEDDTVSVQSSKIIMVKNAKGVKLPHIIGTELFKADKAIGLDVPPDEEEENDKEKEENEDEDEFDPEVSEFMSDLTVSEKQKAKWEKIKQKKAKQKQKMTEKLKKQKTQNNQQNIQPQKEQEVKVPIENEEEPKKQEEPKAQKVKESDNIKIVANSGGSIPPPPPPPPKPVFTGVKKPPKKQEPKKVVQNPVVQNSVIPPNPANENPLNPNIPSENAQLNPILEVKPPVANKPMSFEEQLRNRIMNRGKGNTNANANNNTIENNNLNNPNNNDNSVSNSLMSITQTLADNKNPLAPVIHNTNVVVTKQSIKLNNFMGGGIDDEENDDIDIKKSIFNHQKKVSQNKPMIMNVPSKSEQIQNQISKNIPPVIKEEPQEEEPKPIENQNIQPPKQVMPQQIPQMFKPPETQFIKIKENEKLKKAGSKMKSLFESDDEEESKPNNIVDKTKDLTIKLSTIGIVSNPPPTNIQKNDVIKPKPKASFFNDDDDDDNNKKEVKNDIPKVNNIIPTNNNINKNPVVQQPPKKPKISFFADNDNNEEPQKKVIENKPVPPPQKKQPDFLAGLKEKLMQATMNNQMPMKKPEPKVEEKQPQIEEPKKEEIKVEEPKKEEKNNLPVSLTMRDGEDKSNNIPQSKTAKNSYLRFPTMLASRLGQGMMLGGPRPKVEEERKTEYTVPPTNVEATYEEVIEAKKTKVVKKKKPKRTGTFGTGELIPIKKPNPPPEEPIKENQEGPEQEQKKEEPKLEEIKQEEIKPKEPKVEEIKAEEPKVKEEVKVEEVKVEQPKQEEIKKEEPEKKENNEPPVPEPQENKDKSNEAKNSLFMLFTDNKEKEEPKKTNLFEKIDLEALPEVEEKIIPVQNNKIDLFSNNAPKEVEKSKLFFLDDDKDDKPPTNKINKMFGEQNEKNVNDNKIKVQPQPAKKKLAFFDDDD